MLGPCTLTLCVSETEHEHPVVREHSEGLWPHVVENVDNELIPGEEDRATECVCGQN